MEEITYKVYIQTDDSNRVTAVNSSAFLTNLTDWIEVDEGTGDKYHHAQGHYLPLGLMTEDGIYLYKYVDGKIQERSENEIQVDREEQLANRPQTLEERLAEQEAILTALLQGV